MKTNRLEVLAEPQNGEIIPSPTGPDAQCSDLVKRTPENKDGFGNFKNGWHLIIDGRSEYGRIDGSDIQRFINSLPEPDSESPKPSATDYLAKRKANLTKLVAQLGQQVEQITAQANNEIGARQQNITAAKAEIAEIEGLLGE